MAATPIHTMRLSEERRAAYTAAADKAGSANMADWMRQTCDEAAGFTPQPEPEPVVKEAPAPKAKGKRGRPRKSEPAVEIKVDPAAAGGDKTVTTAVEAGKIVEIARNGLKYTGESATFNGKLKYEVEEDGKKWWTSVPPCAA